MPLLDTRQGADTLDGRFVADLVLQILSYVAEKERVNINARIRSGIDAMAIVDGKKVSAKTGRPTGRPVTRYPAGWEAVCKEWKAGEITAVKAMGQLGLKKNTFYKLAKECNI
jgi:DNA invertase Pin-like site-specific DNA recombinase